MPLDGVFIAGLTDELSRTLIGARVDKIQMPEKDEVVFQLHGPAGSGRLLVSANTNWPRLHMSRITKENPMSPPMFCMLLRKHLSSAKIIGISQPGLERMIKIDFLAQDELGEQVGKSLACELMGRYSNLVLVGSDGRIIDCLKRVDITSSEKRQLLPGMIYRLPPLPDKRDFAEADFEAVLSLLEESGEDIPLERWIISRFFGISPLICRELAERACGDAGARLSELDDAKRRRLADETARLAAALRETRLEPWALIEPKGRGVRDFSVMEITQYGDRYISERQDGFSTLLEKYYTEKDQKERLSRSSADISRLVSNTYERTLRKLVLQRQELCRTHERDLLRQKADILSASIHLLGRGMEGVTLENFYGDMEPVEIKLDARLLPQQNIARYYKEYNRMKSAEQHLSSQIAAGEREVVYLESVMDELARAGSEREIGEIRAELRASGYLAREKTRSKAKRMVESQPVEYRTSSGRRLAAGRNNLQNDRLTMKTAGKRDYWFHVKNLPGSHVILETGGDMPLDADISEAALVAAFHSKAGEGDFVEVDYCPVSHVRKPGGAKPGMVIYEGYNTVRVVKSSAEIEKLGRQGGD